MRNVKVKILGTSNGIVNGGYASHLRDCSRVEVLQNLSIGSSHPTVIAHALTKNRTELKEDFLILDVCVNEQRAISRKRFDKSVSEEMFNFYLSYCYRNSVRPFALLIPVLGSDGKLLTEAVERWKSYCESFNVPYLDVTTLTRNSDELTELWRDPNHPSVTFSEIIANSIVNSLPIYESQPVKNPRLESNEFDVIALESDTKVTRSTKLLSVNFSIFVEGDSIVVTGKRDFRVLGFSLDMAHTHAALKIKGENQIIQRFDNQFYDEERKLWYVSWSLAEPVISKDCKVDIEIIKPIKDRKYLLNDHTPSEPVERDVVAEFESILIKYL